MDPRVKKILEDLLAGENILYDDFQVLAKYLEDAVIGYDPKFAFIPLGIVRKIVAAAWEHGAESEGTPPSGSTIDGIIKSNVS